jgi:hypothetical protein
MMTFSLSDETCGIFMSSWGMFKTQSSSDRKVEIETAQNDSSGPQRATQGAASGSESSGYKAQLERKGDCGSQQ